MVVLASTVPAVSVNAPVPRELLAPMFTVPALSTKVPDRFALAVPTGNESRPTPATVTPPEVVIAEVPVELMTVPLVPVVFWKITPSVAPVAPNWRVPVVVPMVSVAVPEPSVITAPLPMVKVEAATGAIVTLWLTVLLTKRRAPKVWALLAFSVTAAVPVTITLTIWAAVVALSVPEALKTCVT